MVSLFERSLLLDAVLATSAGADRFEHLLSVEGADAPATILTDGTQWVALRSAFDDEDPIVADARTNLLERAANCAERSASSVTDKVGAPADVDPRRYRSLAKYWWPNPESPDGLPYVNRDGEVNPEWRDPQFDALRFTRMVDELSTLAIAGYLLRRDDFARASVGRLYRWFLDPATGQLPEFSTAQVRPGAGTSPRGARLIEARHVVAVCESVAILEAMGALPPADSAAFRQWLVDLRSWMDESPDGQAAAGQDNNIGFWFDLQRVVYDTFLGRGEDVREVLRTAVLPRLSRAIGEHGELQEELRRARPGQYLVFTLAAMVGLSNVSAEQDLDLWGGGRTEGRSLDATLDWVAEQLWGGAEASTARWVAEALASGLDTGEAPEPAAWVALQTRDLRGENRDLRATAERLTAELNAAAAERNRAQQQLAEKAAQREELTAELAQERRTSAAKQEELTASIADRDRARRAEASLRQELVDAKDALRRERQEAERRLRLAERRAEAMEESTSWRITAPIRVVSITIQSLLSFLQRAREAISRVESLGDAVELARRVGGRAVDRFSTDTSDSRPVDELATGTRLPATMEPGGLIPSPSPSRPKSKQKRRGKTPVGARPRVTREAPPPPSEGQLLEEYQRSGLVNQPDTFVLYRIIGNDLPPRHASGQSRANVQFILDHEPELEDCEKRWIVNRIIDVEEERQILDLLERHGQGYVRIPFERDEYAEIGLDLDSFPVPGYRFTEEFEQLDEVRQVRAAAHRNRHKNNYVMNNNGARNAALEDGKERAKWVLPWDGNCFLTAEGWEEIRRQAIEQPHIPYIVVPMARITDNALLLRPDFRPDAEEEPQLVFRADRDARFDEEHYYGRRPKVELFWRLAIPGKWDDWQDDVWDLPRPGFRSDAGAFGVAGWVARMASGVAKLEAKDHESFRNRGLVRNKGVLTALRRIDAQALYERHVGGETNLYVLSAIANQSSLMSPDLRRELASMSAEARTRGPFSVVHKTDVGPSGDPHDYWHPAPYWWPNERSPDGLPYVRRDGERVPGTVMYSPESDAFDRTRLQRLFDDVTVLALDGHLNGSGEALTHAARLVRVWFLEPETRMNPHLRYSQVRRGHNDNQGAQTGIIEFKDVYFFLDAVRLLGESRSLSGEDLNRLRGWFEEYVEWLLTSEQGRRECAAANNHGVLYDLQVASIAAFLGELSLLGEVAERAQERLLGHFGPDGRQPHELARRTSAHYCAFNLQSWVNLASVLGSFQVDLYGVTGADGRGLRRGLEWFLDESASGERGWAYEQIDEFDWQRRAPLIRAYDLAYGVRTFSSDPRAFGRPTFHPHDGVPPYWQWQRVRTSSEPDGLEQQQPEVPPFQKSEPYAPSSPSVPRPTGDFDAEDRPLLLVSGFSWSGSSALVDLLLEHKKVGRPPGGEVRFLELFASLVERPWRPSAPQEMLVTGRIDGLHNVEGKDVDRLAWKFERFFSESSVSREEFSEKAQALVDRLREAGLGRVRKGRSLDREVVRGVTTGYLQLVHQAAQSGSNLKLYDNLLHADRLQLLASLDFQELPSFLVWVVDRDPRDQFYELCHVRKRFSVTDVGRFIEEFRGRRDSFFEATRNLPEGWWESHAGVIQFEDLVDDPSLGAWIRDGLEQVANPWLQGGDWDLGSRFLPQESLKNVGRWRAAPDLSPYARIEDELSAWCVQGT